MHLDAEVAEIESSMDGVIALVVENRRHRITEKTRRSGFPACGLASIDEEPLACADEKESAHGAIQPPERACRMETSLASSTASLS